MKSLEEKIGKSTYEVITNEHNWEFYRAYILVNALYKDKKDIDDRPYVLYLYNMCDNLDTEEEKTVALLQNVLKNTPLTEEELKELKFSKNIIATVKLLTKPNEMSFKEYIKELKRSKNLTALKVKREYLMRNLDEEKLKLIPAFKADEIIKDYTKACLGIERTLKKIENKEGE